MIQNNNLNVLFTEMQRIYTFIQCRFKWIVYSIHNEGKYVVAER